MSKLNFTNRDSYTPNHISAGERFASILFSSILLIYGLIGVIVDDLYLPGKFRKGISLHGIPAWIMFGAFLFAAVNLLSVVIDHYDQRNNETNYKSFARITRITGWVLFGLALVLDLFVFHSSRR